MKKIIFFLMFTISVMLTSCQSCSNNNDDTNKAQIEWNLEANAEGEGLFVLAYPTGNLRLEGAASATVSTTSNIDSLLMAVPNNAPCYLDVLADTANYSKEEVMLANEVKSAVYVDSLVGDWNASVVGYVKYDHFYVVIDEHWPKDTTDVDSVTVE